MKKGHSTQYPVPVVEWRRKPGVGPIPPEWSLAEVLKKTARTKLQAVPVDSDNPVSAWQTAKSRAIELSERLKGKNPHQARLGARVEPYGVFWLRLKEVRPDGKLVVENQHDRGKREIKQYSSAIEPELIYPAVSGGDIVRFGIKEPFYVLISQDPAKREGYDEDRLSAWLPLTYAYLYQFKEVLSKRAAYRKYYHKEIKERGKVVDYKPTAPFYSMYNISRESFSRYRVVWKRMAAKMSAVVVSSFKTSFGIKPVIATDTCSLFTAKNAEEAHYLCAVMNSKSVDDFIRSFSSGGRGFGAPSVVKNLAIPLYDDHNKIHFKLSELSRKAHHGVEHGHDISEFEEEINRTTEELWNLRR